MSKYKNYLRKILRPVFLWLGYGVEENLFDGFDVDKNTSGFQRKIIGIYSSQDHSEYSAKGQIWEPIVTKKRQMELIQALATARARKDAMAQKTRSAYIASSLRHMSKDIKTDAEMVFIIDLMNFEAGLQEMASRGPERLMEALSKIGKSDA